MDKDSPFRYDLKTDFGEGIIEQQLVSGTEVLMRWVANTREESIRKALIGLGWTPPVEYGDRIEELTPRWNVSVRFNSRLKGANHGRTSVIQHEDPFKALEQSIAAIVRMPEHGQSIYITGFTVEEVK